MAEKMKESVCAFCGKFGPVTKDHIPPKNLFKGFPINKLITVPACRKCNTTTSKDDEYFRAFLIPQSGVSTHPQASKLNKMLREKFDVTDRKGLEMRMYRQLHEKDVHTPAGIYLGKHRVMYPEYSRIDGTLKKIVRGLFFYQIGVHLSLDQFHVAVVDQIQIVKLQAFLQLDLEYWIEALNSKPLFDVCGVFSFKYALSFPPRAIISAWRLCFFEGRDFFGITYPRSLASSFNLIDPSPNEISRVIL